MKNLFAGLLAFSFVAGTFAVPPPPPPPPPHSPAFAPPPGRHLHPGMTWCPKCEGRGRYAKHWYSFSKPCPKCGGTGMLPMTVPPPPPPGSHHNIKGGHHHDHGKDISRQVQLNNAQKGKPAPKKVVPKKAAPKKADPKGPPPPKGGRR